MPYWWSMARLALAYLAALRAVSAVTIEANTHAAFVRAPLSSPSTRSYGSTSRSWHSRTCCSRSCTGRVRRYCAATPGEEGSGNDSSQDPVEGSGGGKDAGGGGEGGEEGGKAIADNTAPVGNNADHMVSAVSGNGQVVARAVTARNLLQDALVRQDLYPLAADALGRVMVCTMLMAGGLKDRETF
ncbi:unnamed protein product, partial [Ectocarpus fasciculatus]